MRMIIVLCVVLVLTVQARAGVPPYPMLALDSESAFPVVLFCVPDGSGDDLTEAQVYGAGVHLVVDATLTATLYDAFGTPVSFYPLEDIWLESVQDALVFCTMGTVADAPTDAQGRTTFSGPFLVGGGMDPTAGDKLELVVGGYTDPTARVDVYLLTPDLDGDRDVDLSDVVVFVDLYWNDPAYHIAVDYYHDGVLNLSDLVEFAGALNRTCP